MGTRITKMENEPKIQDVDFSTYEKVEVTKAMAEIFPFVTAGDKLIGRYLRRKEGISKNNSTLHIFLRGDTGEEVGVWGSTKLDDLMSNVAFDTIVELTYLGKKQGEQNEYKDWQLFRLNPKTE